MIYSAIGLVIFIFGIPLLVNNGKYRNFFLYSSILVLISFMGIRGDFTTDYPNYIKWFLSIKDYTYSSLFFGKEFVFNISYRILYLFTQNYIVHNFVLAICVCVPVMFAIKELSTDYLLSIFIFYVLAHYGESFNITRNTISISMLLFGYKYIIDRDIKKWIIIVFVSAGIHLSSIILLPLYFISYIKISFRNIVMILIISVILFINYSFGIHFLQNNLGLYANYSQFSYGMWEVDFILKNNIVRITIYLAYFVLLIFRKSKVDQNLYIVIISIMFYILKFRIFMLYRFDLYFFSYFIIIFPNTLNQTTFTKSTKTIIVLSIVLLSIVYASYTYNGIYYPFWQNQYSYS